MIVSDFFLEFFFPSECILCAKNLSNRIESRRKVYRVFCKSCIDELSIEYKNKIFINYFHLENKREKSKEKLSEIEKYFDVYMNLFKFNGIWQRVLYQWKFQNQRDISFIFTYFLEKLIPLFKELSFDCISYIDSGKNMYQSRRYQPCKDIAAYLAKELKIDYGGYIYKIKNYKQSRLNAQNRYLEVLKSMRINHIFKRNPIKNCLLLDDIYTTGSTVNEASRLLKEVGVERVNVLSLLNSGKNE